jgi:hypothetical protein
MESYVSLFRATAGKIGKWKRGVKEQGDRQTVGELEESFDLAQDERLST